MTPHRFILLFLLFLLLAITLLARYTRRQRSVFEPGPVRDRVFRCADEKCELVYTDDADVETSRCPQCGRMNESVRF
jgi:hypothetical protein